MQRSRCQQERAGREKAPSLFQVVRQVLASVRATFSKRGCATCEGETPELPPATLSRQLPSSIKPRIDDMFAGGWMGDFQKPNLIDRSTLSQPSKGCRLNRNARVNRLRSRRRCRKPLLRDVAGHRLLLVGERSRHQLCESSKADQSDMNSRERMACGGPTAHHHATV